MGAGGGVRRVQIPGRRGKRLRPLLKVKDDKAAIDKNQIVSLLHWVASMEPQIHSYAERICVNSGNPDELSNLRGA